ncbi:MAG: YdeI/OmpD-associated family protein [Verrucomicrobiae bacterium]|nr:YdeI/OmpD-associated family protein [Verrucomicrobiae bacterium]
MKTITFSSRVERLEDGMKFHVVPVWEDVAAPLLAAGHRRVVVTIKGRDIRRAIQGPEMGRYVILGMAQLREVGIKFGDAVEVGIKPDATPDAIELTEEFELVLEQDDEARARWEGFTIGRQRSLAHYLTSAKRAETRLKRAIEIAEKLRTYTLYGDTPPKEDRES